MYLDMVPELSRMVQYTAQKWVSTGKCGVSGEWTCMNRAQVFMAERIDSHELRTDFRVVLNWDCRNKWPLNLH